MQRLAIVLCVLFAQLGIARSAEAQSSEGPITTRQHDRLRKAGIEEYKAQKALELAEAERDRKEYAALKKKKAIRDREQTPAFRRWQDERDEMRKEKEIIRKNEARKPTPIIRDRDANKKVPDDQRIDYRKRALYDPSKSLVKDKSSSGRLSGSSGYDSGGGGDFAPPPPPPAPSYSPPAPDFPDQFGDPNGFEPQPGDEIPPPIFDEGDF